MSLEIFVKILSDCALFYAILTAFPTVFPICGSLLLPTLVYAAAAALAACLLRHNHTALARLCAFLPLAALPLAGGMIPLLLPAALYTGAVILRGALWLEYYTYRDTFLKSLKVSVVLLITVLFLSIVSDPNGVREEPLILVGNTIRYGLLYFIFGVVLQRRLRLGVGTRAHGALSQSLALFGGVGAMSVGILAAEPLLREQIAALARTITAAVFAPLAAAYGGVAQVVEGVTDMLRDPSYQQAMIEAEEQVSGGADLTPALPSAVVAAEETLMQQESRWWLPLVILAVLLVMGLLFWSFSKRGGAVSHSVGFSDIHGDGKKKHTPHFSPRARIRHVYRDYLRQEKKRGVVIEKSCTSADILNRLSGGSDAAAAAQLRELYLRARYDEAHGVDRAQAEAAQAALRKICKN